MEMANGKENLIISPIPELVRTPDLERIRNARKRREIQLKEWEQYDRRMQRENEKMLKKGISTDRGGQLNVKFPPSLIFLEASARGDLDEVQKLLSAGVCPDEPNEDGLTALHQCCIDNAPEMCMLLLRFGANVNSRDSELWTPLHAAATCHHTELCRILIAYGADLLAINADGNMPYECCMLGPTLNLIELAMEKQGITQEQLDDVHRQPQCDMLTDMEDLCKAGADFNVMDEQGAAYLHIAAACGFEEVVRFLVKHGAKIDMLDRDGWQAIHIASCWDHFEVVEVLVNYGADIMATTKQGETVFDICEDYEVHKRLLRIKEDYERKRVEKQETMDLSERPKDFVRRRSSTNPRSASVRRSSMKDKKLLSLKEAKQEAEMRVTVTLDRSDEDIDMDKKIDNQLTITHSMQQGHTHANSPHFNHVASNDPKTLEEFRNDNRSVVDGLINSSKPRTSHAPTTIPSTPAYPTKSINGLSPPSVKTQGKNFNKLRTEKFNSTANFDNVGDKRGESNNSYPNQITPKSGTPGIPPIISSRPPISQRVPNSPHTSPMPPGSRLSQFDRHTASSLDSYRLTDAYGTIHSPQPPRTSRSEIFKPKTGTERPTHPSVTAHNAYYSSTPPVPQISSSMSKIDRVNNAPRTIVPPRSAQTLPHGENSRKGLHAQKISRKSHLELINRDMDDKISGKCCLIM